MPGSNGASYMNHIVWHVVHHAPQSIPQQSDVDCGAFACAFLEYRARGCTDFDFTEADMGNFRLRILLDICHNQLWSNHI